MRPIHARKRRRCTTVPKLSMAAMIDVVFLLLVFFVVTTVPQDVMAQLRGARARSDPDATPADIPLVHVDVHAGGLRIENHQSGIVNGARRDPSVPPDHRSLTTDH